MRTLLLLLAPVVFPAPESAFPGAEDSASAALRAWYERWDARQSLWPGGLEEYRILLAQVEGELLGGPDGLPGGAPVLMDLASWHVDGPPIQADYMGRADRNVVRRGARRVIDRVLDGEGSAPLMRWIVDEVLVRRTAALPRRFLALGLCHDRRTTPGKLALLIVARDEADPLWPEVVDTLATWPDEAVDSFLVGRIGKKFDPTSSRHPYTMLLRRIRESDVPLGTRATALLVDRL